MNSQQPIRSDIAWATPDEVVIHGIPNEMLGNVNLSDVAYLPVFKILPGPNESIVFNALEVALVEHGLTSSALVTRLTALGAPGSAR